MITLRSNRQHRAVTVGFLFTIIVTLCMGLAACDSPTAPEPVASNHKPVVPSIDSATGTPADKAVDVPLTAALAWNCSDPDGDAITYTIYFGERKIPSMASPGQVARSYVPANLKSGTTYYWKVEAKDAQGATAVSPVWIFTTANAVVVELISAPGAAVGPGNGQPGINLKFAINSQAISNKGHDIEHQFDWDDGQQSEWTSALTGIHAWANAGSYTVKVRGRCVDHPTIISGWAESSPIEIANAGPLFDVSPGSRSVSSASGTTSFSVSSYVGWSVSDNVSWLTATKTNDSTISVSYEANTSTASRTANIRVYGFDGEEEIVTVTQARSSATFDVSPGYRNVSSASGTTSFSVSSSVGWSVSDNASWLTATKTNGSTISVSYGFNLSTVSRTANIRAYGTGGVEEIVTVTQAGRRSPL